jgi:long-subunit acyl-CoA synthetase (AMP-forming)
VPRQGGPGPDLVGDREGEHQLRPGRDDQAFFLIEQQLTPEDEELTPTMKLKRSFVNTKYKDQIDAMYRPQAA